MLSTELGGGAVVLLGVVFLSFVVVWHWFLFLFFFFFLFLFFVFLGYVFVHLCSFGSCSPFFFSLLVEVWSASMTGLA